MGGALSSLHQQQRQLGSQQLRRGGLLFGGLVLVHVHVHIHVSLVGSRGVLLVRGGQRGLGKEVVLEEEVAMMEGRSVLVEDGAWV